MIRHAERQLWLAYIRSPCEGRGCSLGLLHPLHYVVEGNMLGRSSAVRSRLLFLLRNEFVILAGIAAGGCQLMDVPGEIDFSDSGTHVRGEPDASNDDEPSEEPMDDGTTMDAGEISDGGTWKPAPSDAAAEGGKPHEEFPPSAKDASTGNTGGQDAGEGEDAGGGEEPPTPEPDAGRDAATPPQDAAAEEDAGPSCDKPNRWYADDDGDGYGDSSRSQLACVQPPNTAAIGGDCADQDERAHPGQTTYFGTPYARPSGGISYDFNCSGREEGQPGLQLAPESCGLLAITACQGSGYAPTGRSGNQVNAFCGSEVIQTCQPRVGVLICEVVAESIDVPYGCR